MKTPCPRCGKQQLQIQTAKDNFAKEIRCLACEWFVWLKNFNKKQNKQK